MSTPQNCCSTNNLCHVAKGVGYGCGAAGSALAIAAVVATVTALAVGFFIIDAHFIYSLSFQPPLNLLWAIPVTLAFIAIDVLIMVQIGKIGLVAGKFFSDRVKTCGREMLQHFQAV